MKTLILTTALLILLISNMSANTIEPEGIKDLIKKEISYPEFALQQKIEGTVLVSFLVSEEGLINVELANASNEDLKNYVIGKLKSLIIKDADDNKYNMKFEFKLK